jgi:hypothetical protein
VVLIVTSDMAANSASMAVSGMPSARSISPTPAANLTSIGSAPLTVMITGSKVFSLTHRISCCGFVYSRFAYQFPSFVVDGGGDGSGLAFSRFNRVRVQRRVNIGQPRTPVATSANNSIISAPQNANVV